MSIVESMPSSYNATPYFLGAVAFHRCFYAVYDEMCELGYDIAEGKGRLEDMVANPGSRAHQMLAGEIKKMLGRPADDTEFRYAVKGFLVEAEDRYVMRASEIEIVRTQTLLAGMEEFDSGSFRDAAEIFRNGI